MGWLFDNFLANMPGPSFLVFYPICAGVILAAAYFFIAMQDTTGGRPPPAIQGAVDPYELAYLRGGINEIIRTAVYSLRQKGLIEIVEQKVAFLDATKQCDLQSSAGVQQVTS